MLARVYRLTQGRIPLIGIGGIDSGAAAIAKIEAGATLLQLYTGLVFEGPGLLARIKQEMCPYGAREACPHRRCHGPPRRGMGGQGARGMMRRPGFTCSGLASSGVR